MMIRKILFTLFFLLLTFQPLVAIPLAEQFRQTGYAEICDKNHGVETFNHLYALFDEMIEFLQLNPRWVQKLYCAKERFMRSKHRNRYSTDFFGFYDESHKQGRNQIAFYYSTHFHEFICIHYPELNALSSITRFFEACREIQQTYEGVFKEAVAELGLEKIFPDESPPILFKVIKYLPQYKATRPHYDGSALTLFLDSTDNSSLFLSSYQFPLTIENFFCPPRKFLRQNQQNSILLIPGALLTEFSIYPTPHIVTQSDNYRYAAIAFAMRPDYPPKKNEFFPLPSFSH